MPNPYRPQNMNDTIDSLDGAPTVKGCTLFGPPSSAQRLEDGDLIVPAGIVVTRCPPGVARGASSWSWRSSDGIGRRGSRTPARGGA